MPGPALVAGTAGNRWIHNYHISGLETCYLLSHLLHDRTALVANTKGETHDLVPNPSLRVVVEIGSADACADDPEQYVGRTLKCRSGPFHDFNFPNSCKYHGFHNSLSCRTNPDGVFSRSLWRKNAYVPKDNGSIGVGICEMSDPEVSG
jgi:hypothetical protein